MLKFSRGFISCLVGGFTFLSLSSLCRAAESANPATVLAPYVNDDTLAAAYVDVGSIKASGNVAVLLRVLPPASAEAQKLMLGAMMIDGCVQRFQRAGGQSLYLVAGLADIYIGGGPIAIATARPGERPEDVEQLFRDMIRELSLNQAQGAAGAKAWQFDVARKGDLVLVGTKSTVARYAALKSSSRTELVEPLVKLVADGAIAAGVFCPGQDYRRVSRELWPQLPGALAPLRGELADRWRYFEAAVNSPPNSAPRITLQAKDPEAAEIFATLWRDLPTATTQFGGNDASAQKARQAAQLLVDSLPTKVEGTRVSIAIPTDDSQLSKLQAMFAEAANDSIEPAHRRQRADKFKQLSLAMLMYYEQNKHLPAVAAICDKDGKPLLSWRVALLPYIEQEQLYKEFHLDEPWDSPHNSSLIAKMPDLFADPDATLAHLAHEGKTTFQVPAGPETLFFNNKGTKLSEVTDGTANTIMLVDVAPAHAVEWTKPADWEVDLKNPSHGLERDEHHALVAAFADGHVQLIALKPDYEKKLRAQLTRAGGEKGE